MAAYMLTPSGDVLLALTTAEARGLVALANEGAEAILTDPGAARSYVGGPSSVEAAERAIHALRHASASST